MHTVDQSTDGNLAEMLLAGDRQLLEMIARGECLRTILESLCRLVEEISSGALCSVLLLDASGECLRHGAAPSLPQSYSDAVNGSRIGPNAGSCGSAAFRKEQVIVSDIQADPLWKEWRDLARRHQLGACWSSPILSSAGTVLGTFAVYFRMPRSPTTKDREIIAQFAHLASIAIERARREDDLRRNQAYLAEAQRLSHTGSFGWNVDTREIIWSEETFRILEIAPGTKPILDLVFQRIHPDDALAVKELLDAKAREGMDLDFQHRLLLPGGVVKHIRVVARASRTESGALEYLGAVSDVTGRENVEARLRASEQLARGQVDALTRTLDALAMESVPDRLCEHVLRTITEQLGAHACSVWQRDEATGMILFEFAFENGKMVTKADANVSLPAAMDLGDVCPAPEVLRSGKPGVLEDIRLAPPFPRRDLLLAQGIVTLLAVPMLITGRVEGVMTIRFKTRRAFHCEELDLAKALANQATLAIQLTRLSARSRDAAVMAERNRLARDIHDTLAQGFTGVIVQLEAAEDALSRGLAKETQAHLVRAGAMARQGLNEARRSVQALRPQILEKKNLCAALEELIRLMTAGTCLQAEFTAPHEPHQLPAEWEDNLLRVGQEVLTNTLRHARASRFEARLQFGASELTLEMRDNGAGFDPGLKVDGFGLIGMKERVESMGGRLAIESVPGAGTLTNIVLPFPLKI